MNPCWACKVAVGCPLQRPGPGPGRISVAATSNVNLTLTLTRPARRLVPAPAANTDTPSRSAWSDVVAPSISDLLQRRTAALSFVKRWSSPLQRWSRSKTTTSYPTSAGAQTLDSPFLPSRASLSADCVSWILCNPLRRFNIDRRPSSTSLRSDCASEQLQQARPVNTTIIEPAQVLVPSLQRPLRFQLHLHCDQDVLPLQSDASCDAAPVLLWSQHARAGHHKVVEGCRGHLRRQLLHYYHHGHIRHI